MSRLTSAQIINLGEYLEPDFDPTTLTVSQILGILGYHDINYPTPYSKSKLVQVFTNEITLRSSKLKNERLKRENSQPSDDGIIDGVTGQPVGGNSKSFTARRSSRRLSNLPSQEELSPPLPDPPKRRRSSAQPKLGSVSRKVIATQSTLQEESEPDEELPPKKVGRSKKTSVAAGAQSRRMSHVDDSGWEDNNIFQSGAESSSPARPSPTRPKRSGPRKSHKFTSAPPEIHSSSSPSRTPYVEAKFPKQSSFKPILPTITSSQIRLVSPTVKKAAVKDIDQSYSAKQNNSDDGMKISGNSSPVQSDENDDINGDKLLSHEEDIVVPQDSNTKLVETRPTVSYTTKALLSLVRFLLVLSILAVGASVVNYKSTSASIGFCDTGSNTNKRLEQLKARRLAVESCNKENRTYISISQDDTPDDQNVELCPLPPLVPTLYPETCTQCPEHATCSQHAVSCNTGYILHPPWLFSLLPASPAPSQITFSSMKSPVDVIWKVISFATDGWPGLGSVAFPPRCLPDPKRKRNIGVLGKAIESILGQEKGRRLCQGGSILKEVVEDDTGGDARKWGIEIGKLREVMRAKTALPLIPTFDDMFDDAIQQLVQWGGVITDEDQEGHRYLAHRNADMTWNCVLTVKCRNIWTNWRNTFISVIAILLGIFLMRARIAQRKVESKRVAELVQIALDTLRNQEIAHHTDPITIPHPYLSSLHLRDLVLQDEHSIPIRRKLWDRVEHVVEGNANVRVNLEEIEGGDETRVWRWIGSAGKGVKRFLE